VSKEAIFASDCKERARGIAPKLLRPLGYNQPDIKNLWVAASPAAPRYDCLENHHMFFSNLLE